MKYYYAITINIKKDADKDKNMFEYVIYCISTLSTITLYYEWKVWTVTFLFWKIISVSIFFPWVSITKEKKKNMLIRDFSPNCIVFQPKPEQKLLGQNNFYTLSYCHFIFIFVVYDDININIRLESTEYMRI